MNKKVKSLYLWLFLIGISILVCKDVVSAKTTETNNDNTLAVYEVETGETTYITNEELEYYNNINMNTNVAPTTAENIEIQQISNSELSMLQECGSVENELFYDTASINDIASINTVTDNRKLVSNPDSFPYYCTCKLYLYYADGTSACGTGFAVGKKLCATARHCITNSNNSWLTYVKAYYGYNKGNYTYKATDLYGYIYYPDYTYGEIEGDYAFLIWNNTTSSDTGCFGMSGDASIGLSCSTMGYPTDLYNGLRMIYATGSISNYTDVNLFFTMQVKGGQSGSPIYITKSNGPYALGIVTHNSESAGYNIGRRLDSSLIGWLIEQGYA